MQWKDLMTNELRVTLILASVFMSILLSNMIDSQRFKDLGHSFKTVYEDRLVAKSYLFKLSSQLQRKETTINEREECKSEVNQKIDNSIAFLIERYEKTELTSEESRHLDSLKSDLVQLYSLEEQMKGDLLNGHEKVILVVAIGDQHQKISTDLEILSEIQILEGKKLLESSSKTIAASYVTTGLEIIFLIGLIAYILFYSYTKAYAKFFQNSKIR